MERQCSMQAETGCDPTLEGKHCDSLLAPEKGDAGKINPTEGEITVAYHYARSCPKQDRRHLHQSSELFNSVAVEVWRSTICLAQLEGWSPSLARQEINGLQHARNYDLFEIGRSHFGNPGVVIGSEARFLLQGMNLALHLRHLVV